VETDPDLLQLSDDMRAHVKAADSAAAATDLRPLPFTELTRDLDPELRVSRSFSQYLSGSPLTSEEAGESLQRRRLSRAVLLEQGRALHPSSSDDELRSFLWLVNAWGYGTSGRGAARTRPVAEDPQFPVSARLVLGVLHDTSRTTRAVDAYYLLNNSLHVTGWGPAFFTKFLTFADPSNQPDFPTDPAGEPDSSGGHLPALILDRWMATVANYHLPVEVPQRVTRKTPLATFRASGWTTPQYAYYLRLMSRLASQEPLKSSPYDGRAVAVERALFDAARNRGGFPERAG